MKGLTQYEAVGWISRSQDSRKMGGCARQEMSNRVTLHLAVDSHVDRKVD